MQIERLNTEILIHRGSQTYTWSDKELEKLGKTTFTEKPNYMCVLKRIPEYFGTNDLFMCMMLAFSYGEMKGRACEAEKIKWNAGATFGWMKIYYEKKGCFPDTEKDLWDWEHEFMNELDAKEGMSNA